MESRPAAGHTNRSLRRLGGRPRSGTWLHLLLCRLKRLPLLQFIRSYRLLLCIAVLVIIAAIISTVEIMHRATPTAGPVYPPAKPPEGWQAPDTSQLYRLPEAELIRYGRKLVAATS